MATSTKSDTVVETDSKTEITEPKSFQVVLHNDDVTTFEFVISLCTTVFRKDFISAIKITQHVHERGRGVVGVYSKEIAEQKTIEAIELARSNGFPLEVTFEEL